MISPRARMAAIVTTLAIVACGLDSYASSKLHHYALNECAKTFCVNIEGDEAFFSQIQPTIAADHVQMHITSTKGVSKTYSCDSMAYILSTSLIKCENTKHSLVVDLANSTVVTF